MARATSDSADPERQLKRFIAKFDPKNQEIIRSARKILRRRFPTATELVYDNYNFFVIGYGPTERPSASIISIAAAANGVGLCFIAVRAFRIRRKTFNVLRLKTYHLSAATR
jgi:hypothetical protein